MAPLSLIFADDTSSTTHDCRNYTRDLLISIPPEDLDRALQGWNAQMAATDEGLAIDGKTMRNAIDEAGRQTHILGAVGHQSQAYYTQKKSPRCP